MRGLGALLAIHDTVDSMDGSSVSITSGSPGDDSNYFDTGGGAAIAITTDDDSAIIAASNNGNVFVDFNATWCGPCRAFGPVVEQLAGEYPGMVFKVDTDKNPNLANKYGISSIPSLMIMRNGQIGKRGVGGSGIGTLRQWMGAAAPVSAPQVTTSGAPSVADTVSSGTTTYSGAEGWGNPPDNTGWKQVLLNGQKYWNKGGANGQFTAAAQTTGAAVASPTLVTQTTDQASAPPVYGKVPSPLFSTPTPSSAPAAAVAPTGNVSVTVSVAADSNAWSYILQKGNPKWQAVILDGVHAFRNKNTGSFQKGESIRGMSGMRMGGLGFAGIAGFLGAVTVSVPTYTTVKSGGGGSIGKTVGIVAGSVVGIGLLGYLIYRAVR